MKIANYFLVLMCTIFLISVEKADAQKRHLKKVSGRICGNPKIKCKTGDIKFAPNAIPFQIPTGNNVIYESEFFYAAILKSVKLKSNTDCETAISEKERLNIQNLFPENKVFALKCLDAGDLYYTNVEPDISFIAVYAGKTKAEAERFLQKVQSESNFKGTRIRRMQAGINGT